MPNNSRDILGWLYWANQLGAIVASSVIAYVCQNVDFSIGWSLACIALIFGMNSVLDVHESSRNVPHH